MDGWRDLVLYDGECGLCDRSVDWLLRHDRRGVLTFAPLQGQTARPFAGEPLRLDTMLFVERRPDGGTRVYDRSAAAFRILRRLGGPWHLVGALSLLPRAVTDRLYAFVASRRHRWFGRRASCRVPDASVRARFLP
jgi:predicted DCC family thiol-disulfide oxidoreductase YuxK